MPASCEPYCELTLPAGQSIIRGKPFPLAIAPPSDDFTLKDSVEWAEQNKDLIKSLVSSHGAVLLRNFPLKNADAFHSFLMAFDITFGSYRGGGGPRVQVKGPIHTSTETPADVNIAMHHELAYLTVTPAMLMFFCEIPPARDGYTPLLDSNTLYEAIKAGRPEFIHNLETKGVRYVRLLKDKTKCDFQFQRSWEDALETSDKTEAEDRIKEVGGEIVEWLDDGSMKVTSRAMSAIQVDARTQLPIFFNSVVLLHPVIRGMKAEETLWAPKFGDFSEIEEDDVLFAFDCMNRLCQKFKYEQGDVVFVDNKLALHGRTSFVGPRRILAAISAP